MPKHGEGIQPHEHNAGHSATAGAEENRVFRQENQDRTAILPSYLTGILREGAESKWFNPKKDDEVLKGWDSLAEYAFDMADVFPKPNTPNIPKDDIDALDADNHLAHGMTANEWEKEVLWALRAADDTHLIPRFKQDMQDYRKAVKGIVQIWREKGLL